MLKLKYVSEELQLFTLLPSSSVRQLASLSFRILVDFPGITELPENWPANLDWVHPTEIVLKSKYFDYSSLT